MAKYQFKIEIEADPAVAPVIEPTLEVVEAAIEKGVAAQLGEGYTVTAYAGERTDID